MKTFNEVLRKAGKLQFQLRRWAHQRLHAKSKTIPVYVVGSQRSGTTMTIKVFDRSLDALVYHTRDKRAYNGGTLLPNEIIRKCLASSRASVTVFKPMNQIQQMKEFLQDMPDLRIIWLLRNYGDAVNSCIRRWKTMLDTLKKICTDPSTAGWHGEAIPERLLETIRAHYHDDMTLESANALFWYLRNQFYFEHSLDQDKRVRIVRYEDLVTEPTSQFREIFQFCGCPFSPRVVSIVFSSSIGRNTPPQIEPRIKKLCEELTDKFNKSKKSTE